MARAGRECFEASWPQLFPSRARQAYVRPMCPCPQNRAAARIPAKEKHVVLQVGGTPERFPRGIEPEQFADTLVGLDFAVTGRVLRPAHRPGGSGNSGALVRAIP